MPNPICHFEIGVRNMQAGTEFYKKLFGWEIKGMPEMEYAGINTGEEPGGGIFEVKGEVPPHLTIYVKVDDIDAKLAEAEALGAKIVAKKTKISDEHGYYGAFGDPDGSVIGLWSKE